jgi:hypothetical protein
MENVFLVVGAKETSNNRRQCAVPHFSSGDGSLWIRTQTVLLQHELHHPEDLNHRRQRVFENAQLREIYLGLTGWRKWLKQLHDLYF